MSCFPELTYALHADGELDPEERAAVDRHLAGCARCRDLRAALELENQVLAAALAAPAAAALPAPRPAWRAAALTGALAAALAFLLAAGREASPASAAPDWVGPAVQAALFLARHADTLAGLLPRLAGLATVVVALGALALLARRAPRSAVALLGLAGLLLGGAPPAGALETRAARVVTVAAGDRVDGPLVVAADEVVVDGTVEGDLIALAGQVRIRGTVRGDLILAGRAAEIGGAVDGHVYALAGEVAIGGRVTRSLYALARAVQLGPGGVIAGDVSVLGRRLALDGTVGRAAWGLVSVATVGGTVGRDLALRADRVAVRPPARVGGQLIVEVAHAADAAVDPAVAIAGARRITARAGGRSGWAALHGRLASYLWTVVRYVAAWLFGVALLALAPGSARRSVEALGAWWPSLGAGLVTLLVVPVALGVAGLTVVGLPLALAGLALYALVVYTAPLVAGLFVGRLLIRQGAGLRGAALALALGLGILTAAFAVPAAGWALWLVAVAAGTGALVRGLRPQGTSTVSVHPAPARR
jgi:cytoskeletal protein CcmA (bactofilin family)